MYISKKLAEEIAREVENVTNFYFTIIDDTGTILACTNSARVGTKHEGTYIMMNNDLNELYVERENQYEGCTQGIIMSVRFASKIIGFIGLTGVPEEIIEYGRIIQKMTELLVYEKFEGFRQELDENEKDLLVKRLINGVDSSSIYDEKKELLKYGLDVSGSFTVAVIQYLPGKQSEENRDAYEAKRRIAKRYAVNYLSEKGNLVAVNNDYCIMITNRKKEYIHQFLEQMFQHIESQYRLQAAGAISDSFIGYENIPLLYNQAASAIRFLLENNRKGVYVYNPQDLEFIIKQISKQQKENLFKEFFSIAHRRKPMNFEILLLLM